MKAFKLLPVMAAVSLALTGCGSASKSGGDPTPPPKPSTKYTFQFIQMEVNKPVNTIPASCSNPTYFKEYRDQSGALTGVDYAKIATGNIDVHVYKADGSFSKDLTSGISSSGQLTISADDIEEGGYVTVFDNLGTSSNRIFHTLSIQKELLGNYLINVESLQGNLTSCYTQGALAVSSQEKAVSLSHESGLTTKEFGYETYRDGKKTDANSVKREISMVNTSEEVLFTGTVAPGAGATSDVTRLYAKVSAGSLSNDVSGSTPNTLILSSAPNQSNLDWSSVAGKTISSTVVNAYTSSAPFVWQNIHSSDPTIYYTDSLNYSVTNKGSESTWSIESNTKYENLAQGIDVKLTSATISNGVTPDVNSCPANCVVDTKGAVVGSNLKLQRSYFEVSANAKHTIYSAAPADYEVVIPKFAITGIDPTADNSSPEISLFGTDDVLTTELLEVVMSDYNSPGSTSSFVDKVSVVATPTEAKAFELKKVNTQYELIQRP